jgi:hypothetical protein
MATEPSLDFESDPEPGRVSRLPDLPQVASVLRQSGSDRRISPNGLTTQNWVILSPDMRSLADAWDDKIEERRPIAIVKVAVFPRN